MEYLETADPEKKQLIEEVRRRKEKLDAEANALAKKGQRVMTNALIIGGVLIGSYLVYRAISGSKQKEKKNIVSPAASPEQKKQSASFFGSFGKRLTQVAAIFILNLARQRVADWLASNKKEK